MDRGGATLWGLGRERERELLPVVRESSPDLPGQDHGRGYDDSQCLQEPLE
jgi:hypothetical protein